MKQLYFLRHGLTDMNISGHFSGHSEAMLTGDGSAQARLAGEQALQNGLKFDLILSSPMQRARDTARLFAQFSGHNHLQIKIHDDLIERNFGDIDGVHNSEVPISRNEYVTNPFALDHIANVERITQLQARAAKVLDYLHSLEQEVVLVVSHGAFGRALERAVKDLHITDFGTPLNNAELVRLV